MSIACLRRNAVGCSGFPDSRPPLRFLLIIGGLSISCSSLAQFPLENFLGVAPQDTYQSLFPIPLANGQSSWTLKGNYQLLDQTSQGSNHLQYLSGTSGLLSYAWHPQWAGPWEFGTQFGVANDRFSWAESPYLEGSYHQSDQKITARRATRLGTLTLEAGMNQAASDSIVGSLANTFSIFAGAPALSLNHNERTLGAALSSPVGHRLTLDTGLSFTDGSDALALQNQGNAIRFGLSGQGLSGYEAIRWQKADISQWTLYAKFANRNENGAITRETGSLEGSFDRRRTESVVTLYNRLDYRRGTTLLTWLSTENIHDSLAADVPVASDIGIGSPSQGLRVGALASLHSSSLELGGDLQQHGRTTTWSESLRVAKQPLKAGYTAAVSQFLNAIDETGNLNKQSLWLVTPRLKVLKNASWGWWSLSVEQMIPLLYAQRRQGSVPTGPTRSTYGGLTILFEIGHR